MAHVETAEAVGGEPLMVRWVHLGGRAPVGAGRLTLEILSAVIRVAKCPGMVVIVEFPIGPAEVDDG